jgi:uncharacterized cupin superfamily protein
MPQDQDWSIVNATEATWRAAPGWGRFCRFEPDGTRFRDYGINIHVLEPGEVSTMYHGEDAQEDFLVLAGECLVLVEREERRLRAWDFVHCPPGTEHIFVGAGDGPCVILMVGARAEDWNVVYPVSELAARYGASADEETSDPRRAYVPRFEPSRRGRPSYWDRLPWA